MNLERTEIYTASTSTTTPCCHHSSKGFVLNPRSPGSFLRGKKWVPCEERSWSGRGNHLEGGGTNGRARRPRLAPSLRSDGWPSPRQATPSLKLHLYTESRRRSSLFGHTGLIEKVRGFVWACRGVWRACNRCVGGPASLVQWSSWRQNQRAGRGWLLDLHSIPVMASYAPLSIRGRKFVVSWPKMKGGSQIRAFRGFFTPEMRK